MVVLKSTKKHDDDYLEFREFRLFLQALRQFFEYYQAFSRYENLTGFYEGCRSFKA